jgi:Tfp pilus assembly protein PilF
MNTKTVVLLSLLILLFLIIASCAIYLPQDEVKFGIEAAQKGLWDEAIFRWERALHSNPNSFAAHNNLAVAYEKKGDFDKAEKEYKKALELSPENEHIQSNYKKFKENLNKIEKDEKKDEKEQTTYL